MPPTLWAFSPNTQHNLSLPSLFDLDFLSHTTLSRNNLFSTSATTRTIIHSHIPSYSIQYHISSSHSSNTLLANVRTPTSSMGVMRHPRRRKHHHHFHWLQTFTTFTFLFFSSTSAITTLTPQPSGGAVRNFNREDKENGSPAVPVTEEKRFGGPGSSPPSCRSKCGWCNPCQPVHVPVQPGLIIRLEYYPEAWRCKCGNKLFMP